jgi:leader peptidase (prepilin peptidase)/N-methyltransferase
MLKIVGRIINFLAWFGFAILVVLLLIVPPVARLMVNPGDTSSLRVQQWLDYMQHAQAPAMRIFCFGWVFFLGSCIASFLNVVAWRVPRGRSILGSSQCPNCNVKLTFPVTNLPILGWLRNGGCCAKCDAPISVRYLIAELVLGASFLLLFVLQTATGGASIPFREINPFMSLERGLLAPDLGLLATLVFHLTILSLIFTLAIAATEKFSAPISLVGVGVIATILFQYFSPAIGMVDFRFGEWNEGIGWNRFLSLVQSPSDYLIATALAIAATAASFQAIRLSNHKNLHGSFACLFLIGIAFGWQAVLSVTAFTCVLLLIIRFNVSGTIFVATLLHLCVWRMQTTCAWWPGPASGLQQLVCGAVYIALAVTAYRFLGFSPSDTAAESHADLPITESDLE